MDVTDLAEESRAYLAEGPGQSPCGFPPGYSSNVGENALPLMPCFLKDHNQAYEEGVIVGRLLAGYGELEMAMCACIIEETRG